MDIVIDFDGTCVTHEFPNIGEEIGAVSDVHIPTREVDKNSILNLIIELQ